MYCVQVSKQGGTVHSVRPCNDQAMSRSSSRFCNVLQYRQQHNTELCTYFVNALKRILSTIQGQLEPPWYEMVIYKDLLSSALSSFDHNVDSCAIKKESLLVVTSRCQ